MLLRLALCLLLAVGALAPLPSSLGPISPVEPPPAPMVDPADNRCTQKYGTCGNTKTSLCSGGEFQSGLCSGPKHVQCCVGGAVISQCEKIGGQCKAKREGCALSFQPGLCPGAADVQCCVGDIHYSERQCILKDGVCGLKVGNTCRGNDGSASPFISNICGKANKVCCVGELLPVIGPTSETPSFPSSSRPSPPGGATSAPSRPSSAPAATCDGACDDVKANDCDTGFIPGRCRGGTNIQCCEGRLSPKPPPASAGGSSSDSAVDPNPACTERNGVCGNPRTFMCDQGGQFEPGLCGGADQCCAGGVLKRLSREKPPPFDELKRNYPQGSAQEVLALIFGDMNTAWIANTCAIRMSRALGYSGVTLPALPNGNTIKGADNKRYAFRVAKLRDYVIARFGPATIVSKAQPGTEGVDVKLFQGQTGIIAFTIVFSDATGHFDLWDGHKMVEASHATDDKTAEYFGRAKQVELWKC